MIVNAYACAGNPLLIPPGVSAHVRLHQAQSSHALVSGVAGTRYRLKIENIKLCVTKYLVRQQVCFIRESKAITGCFIIAGHLGTLCVVAERKTPLLSIFTERKTVLYFLVFFLFF